MLTADVDVALNTKGDEIAANMLRTDKLEDAALNKPMFSVQRSSSDQNVPVDGWSLMNGNAWATPLINTGFNGWSGGVLTIARSGVYTIGGHVQFYGQAFATVGVQIVKNSYPSSNTGDSRVDTTDGIAKDEWGGGGGSVPAATATAYGVARLVAGDKIRMFVLQRNAANAASPAGRVPFDLTLSLMWEDN